VTIDGGRSGEVVVGAARRGGRRAPVPAAGTRCWPGADELAGPAAGDRASARRPAHRRAHRALESAPGVTGPGSAPGPAGPRESSDFAGGQTVYGWILRVAAWSSNPQLHAGDEPGLVRGQVDHRVADVPRAVRTAPASGSSPGTPASACSRVGASRSGRNSRYMPSWCSIGGVGVGRVHRVDPDAPGCQARWPAQCTYIDRGLLGETCSRPRRGRAVPERGPHRGQATRVAITEAAGGQSGVPPRAAVFQHPDQVHVDGVQPSRPAARWRPSARCRPGATTTSSRPELAQAPGPRPARNGGRVAPRPPRHGDDAGRSSSSTSRPVSARVPPGVASG